MSMKEVKRVSAGFLFAMSTYTMTVTMNKEKEDCGDRVQFCSAARGDVTQWLEANSTNEGQR